jgi:hypothetical protein
MRFNATTPVTTASTGTANMNQPMNDRTARAPRRTLTTDNPHKARYETPVGWTVIPAEASATMGFSGVRYGVFMGNHGVDIKD